MQIVVMIPLKGKHTYVVWDQLLPEFYRPLYAREKVGWYALASILADIGDTL